MTQILEHLLSETGFRMTPVIYAQKPGGARVFSHSADGVADLNFFRPIDVVVSRFNPEIVGIKY